MKRKFLWAGITGLMAVNAWAYSGGDGSKESPYRMATKGDMVELANDVNIGNSQEGVCFLLMADVGEITTVIGDAGVHPFSGTFDGGGHRLTVNIRTKGAYVGVFGCTAGAVIRNLGVAGSITRIDAEAESVYVGGLCGQMTDGEMTACYNAAGLTVASSSNSSYVGGLCGYSTATIRNCHNRAATSLAVAGVAYAQAECGGICGYAAADISNCYNEGAVSASDASDPYAGGICGFFYQAYLISNCYNTGAVSASGTDGGEAYSGGICGVAYASSVDHSYNTGVVSASGATSIPASGGICGGFYAGSITACYNTGVPIASGTFAPTSGGICGYATAATIGNCFAANATVEATGSAEVYAGRIVGEQTATLTNNYARADLLVNGGVPAESEKDGSNATLAQFKTLSWLTGTLCWTMDDWQVSDDSPFPTLKVFAAYSGGDGTAQNPYLITTKGDMEALAAAVDKDNVGSGAHFRLMADVDGITTVIGTAATHPFKGTFDGDGYTLTVTIDITGPFAGVFGYARGATIRNLEVAGTVTATGPTGGAVAGGICANMVEGTIHNCRNTGAIASQGALIAYSGGICGVADASSVSNCYNGGEISATATSSAYSGGICGVAEASPVSNSYNTGAVVAVSSSSEDTKASYAGGICGWASAATTPSASIRNCYNTGDIASTASAAAAAYAGGICASGSSLVIDNGYNTGRISSDADTSSATAGGICGSLTSSPSSINNCFAAHASIRATGSSSSAGRVAGRVFNASLTNNYAWAGMLVNGERRTGTDAAGIDGCDKEIAWFQTFAHLEDVLKWDMETTWFVPDGAYPELQVNPALWLTLSATAVTYGDQPVRMFPFDSSVLYTSSNAAVAEVVDDLVYIRGAGRVTIRAFRAGTETDPPARAGAVLTIHRAPLTITAGPASRRYGEANPSVAFSYSPFAYDETEEVLTNPPTARFDATVDTPVGASAIWTAGAAADNYDISYNAGTLTI